MGLSLNGVMTIELCMEVQHPANAFVHKPIPKSLLGKVDHVICAARDILSLLTLACPRLQNLHIACPGATSVIPHQSCNQLCSLTLGTHIFRRYVYADPDPCPALHLQPLLARLTSLTLPRLDVVDFKRNPVMRPQSVAACTSLTHLDLGYNAVTTEMWASLPPTLRQLRCTLGHPCSAPKKPLLASLQHCVLLQWNEHTVTDVADFLAAASNLKELVLHEEMAMHECPGLVVRLYRQETASALSLVHDRLCSGLQLSYQHQRVEAEGDAPSVCVHGACLQLQECRQQLDWDADQGEFIPMSESLGRLQPLPHITDIHLACGPDSDLSCLPLVFPNLDGMVLRQLSSVDQLAPLALCTSLRYLYKMYLGEVRVEDLATAVSRIVSLQTVSLYAP